MRIAIITTSQVPSITANSIQVMKVCQAYCQLGHDVTLVVPGKKSIDWNEIKQLFGVTTEFKIIYFPTIQPLKRYDFITQCGFFLLFQKFDLVHTWMPQIANLSGILQIPYIMELHGLPTGRFGPGIYKKILFSNHKKRFLCITQALQKLFEETYKFKFKSDEILIAPNGVVLEPYQQLENVAELKLQLGLSNKFTAVYTGHLYQGRGMNLLVDLAKRLPDVSFLWVGGREKDVDYWRNKIYSQQIKNIKLTGFVNNSKIPAYQSIGDVLLMPYENSIAGSSGGNSVDFCSPMKMFEYMAAGKPIISSELPILHEVLNEKNAIFCKFDDVEEWVAAIKMLQKNPKTGQELGNQAKIDVRRFTWEERTIGSLQDFVQ